MPCRTCATFIGLRTTCVFCGSRVPAGRPPTPEERRSAEPEPVNPERVRLGIPSRAKVGDVLLQRSADHDVLTLLGEHPTLTAHQAAALGPMPLLRAMATLRRLAQRGVIVSCGLIPASGKRKPAFVYRLAEVSANGVVPLAATSSRAPDGA